MSEATALYKSPGPFDIHGSKLDYKVAYNEDELNSALADGWFLTTPEAINADLGTDFAEFAKTKQELIEHAKSLGIDAKGTWGIAKLNEAIANLNTSSGEVNGESAINPIDEAITELNGSNELD